MAQMPYKTGWTDEQRALVEPLLPEALPGGRPRSTDLREVLNTLLCQRGTGYQYDMLPRKLS